MSTASRWLGWTPGQPRIIETSPRMEPTKPTKPSFDGFDGSVSGGNPIIRGPEPTPANLEGGCPYPLPKGIMLVRYTAKKPPVAITVCSVVIDVQKFIRHALGELDARLHHPLQIKAGDSVFDLLSKLADCGLELRLVWTPESQIIGDSPKPEPSKPTKLPEPPELNAHGADIAEKDIPF